MAVTAERPCATCGVVTTCKPVDHPVDASSGLWWWLCPSCEARAALVGLTPASAVAAPVDEQDRTVAPSPPAPRDAYAVLGVARDASSSEIRRAYELGVNRAHRHGLTAQALELSQAFDAVSLPQRRAAYDRHGVVPLTERSPGAAPPRPSWREDGQWRVASASPAPGRRRSGGLKVFFLGLLVGLALTGAVVAYLVGQVPSAPGETLTPSETLTCPEGGAVTGPVSAVPTCADGLPMRPAAP